MSSPAQPNDLSVSATCEVLNDFNRPCGKPTEFAYPAHPKGWMALCRYHAKPHKAYCEAVKIYPNNKARVCL